MLAFLRLTQSAPRLTAGMAKYFLPVLAAKLDFVDRSKVKEQLLAFFFSGWSKDQLNEAGARYAETIFPASLRPGARERVELYRRNGFRVIIVSASLEEWVAPCAQLLGVECIATRLEYERAFCTGHFATPNCAGEEKVRRIKACLDLGEAVEIHAYGDTPSDRPMLELAQRIFYKPEYTTQLE